MGEQTGARAPAGEDAAELDGVEAKLLAVLALDEGAAGGSLEGQRERSSVGPCPLSHDVSDFDSTRSIDELWTEDVTQPVAGGWPVLEVDTNQPLDVASLAASIQRRP